MTNLLSVQKKWLNLVNESILLLNSWLSMYIDTSIEVYLKKIRLPLFLCVVSKFMWQLKKSQIMTSLFSWMRVLRLMLNLNDPDLSISLLKKPGSILLLFQDIVLVLIKFLSSENFLISCREMNHNGNNGSTETILKISQSPIMLNESSEKKILDLFFLCV